MLERIKVKILYPIHQSMYSGQCFSPMQCKLPLFILIRKFLKQKVLGCMI